MASRLPKATLSLRDFIHRSTVLTLYRDFMRELRGLDPVVLQEMRSEIRREFAKNKNETSKAARKSCLQEGNRQLQFLRTYAGTARRAREVAGVNEGENSWVGSGESWDVKGRIGEGWAWDDPDNAGVGRISPPKHGSTS